MTSADILSLIAIIMSGISLVCTLAFAIYSEYQRNLSDFRKQIVGLKEIMDLTRQMGKDTSAFFSDDKGMRGKEKYWRLLSDDIHNMRDLILPIKLVESKTYNALHKALVSMDEQLNQDKVSISGFERSATCYYSLLFRFFRGSNI